MAARLNELGAINRVSTWPVGVNMSIILGGFEYAKDYIENGGERVDLAKLHEVMTKVASQSPDLTTYVDADGNNITNYFMIFFDRVDFNDYL